MPMRRRNIGQHQVLVRRHDEPADAQFGDRVQPAQQASLRQVPDAAVFDEQGEVGGAVPLLRPAQPIAGRDECKGSGGSEFHRQTFVQSGNEILQSHSVDSVFQPSMLAVGAIAVIALDGDDFLRHIHVRRLVCRSR